jgi:hypothetical protein
MRLNCVTQPDDESSKLGLFAALGTDVCMYWCLQNLTCKDSIISPCLPSKPHISGTASCDQQMVVADKHSRVLFAHESQGFAQKKSALLDLRDIYLL